MVTSEEKVLIAPCGIYCGDCPLFSARTDEDLCQKIAKARGVPKDKLVLCIGCRLAAGNVPGSGEAVCSTYICASNKGVEFCYQCIDFPCLKLAPCADRAGEIPHNTKIYNLLLVKKDGQAAFVRNYRDHIRLYLHGKKPRAGGEIQA